MPNADALRQIDRDSLDQVLRNRMGLILGPSAARSIKPLSGALSARFGVPNAANFLDVADSVLDKDVDENAIRQAIRDYIDALPPPAELRGLAQVRWAGVLSFCLDSGFDHAFQQDAAARANRHPVTILADPFVPLPPRHTPVVKLLGSSNRDDFCCSTATYKARVSTWHGRIRAFSDLVQGAPIVCIGLADTPWFLADLLAAMSAMPTTSPAAVVFLDDGLSADERSIRRTLNSTTALYRVTSTVPEFVSRAIAAQASSTQLALPYGERITEIVAVTRPYEDIVTVVNAHTQSAIAKTEHNRLADLLFSPAIPRWDAFVHKLDFPRTLTSSLMADTQLLAESQTRGSAAVVVTGSAASGKTTLLKRAALDLAQSGFDVLWLKPAAYQDASRTIATILSRIKPHLKESKLIVFMDDPVSFSGLTPIDVAAAAAESFVDIVLVTGLRTTDWASRSSSEITGDLTLMEHHEVPDAFDDREWAALPKYLVRIRAFADIEQSTNAISSRASKTARDTLSMLYWLLPGTKSEIHRSVREEYFRLGDAAAFTRLMVGQDHHTSELLQRAYSMVAVASRWNAPLPVEVLVGALNVSYGDWLNTAGENTGWGLFYPVEGDNADGATYRTRNAIVTDVIMEAINSGRAGHSGEFTIMQNLMSCCTGTQPPYRAFALSILVRNPRSELLTYPEALDLFERAIAALPFKDKTLLHHKGILIRNSGNDPNAARAALNDALSAPQYPHSTKTEADEHIYTSLAANELDALEQHRVNSDEARLRVLTYLHKARSLGFFNPHAVHVEAGLMRRLIEFTPTLSSVDRTTLLIEATANVDRTLLLLEHRQGSAGVAQHIDYLETARHRLLELAPAEPADSQALADRLWQDSRSQAGFVLAARLLYRRATQTNKGSDYNVAHQYASDAIDRVTSSGGVTDLNLLEVWLLIHYHWRVVRKVVVGVGGRIEWQRVHDVATVLATGKAVHARYFYLYLKGLAAAHLGHWGESESVFAEIRRLGLPNQVLFSARDELLQANGKRLTVQGQMTKGGTKNFLHVHEFGVDLILSRHAEWPRAGEIAHAYVRFSFAGPIAFPIES